MTEAFNQARYFADKFGGLPSFAERIDRPYHKVRRWVRDLGYIPEPERPNVLRAAEAYQVDVTAFDFIRHLVRPAYTGATVDG